jgi:hypothetical protein
VIVGVGVGVIVDVGVGVGVDKVVHVHSSYGPLDIIAAGVEHVAPFTYK